ncbi:Lrp/AsnC family transcriptional regulator [Clostridium botulinum]|nr:Lrp/AsnC family transcriptional regulator [Clostridium botulinum]
MDKIDYELMKYLEKDARISIKELSKKVNLSQPAVSVRIKKLEESGCIRGYLTLIDPKIINKNLTCICLISSKNKITEQSFFDFVKKCPDIDECHCITGYYEFSLKISTESSFTLGVLLDTLRKKFGFKSVTYPIVKSIKGCMDNSL